MEDRLTRWLDVVHDLLQAPLTALPHAVLLNELVRTFDAKAGSWIHRQAGGRVDHLLWEQGVRPGAKEIAWMLPRLDQHPLLCWFAATADPAAQTVGRVPLSLVDLRFAEWCERLADLEVDHQMAIPLALRGGYHRAFVLVRHSDDFPDEDVRLARRLQSLLIGLERQAAALARWMPRTPSRDAGLTSRELAVLGLVAEGLTARAIARRLLISPRTVQKHLEHVYSKLRASDKVSAVLMAQALGLLDVQTLHLVPSGRP